MFLWLFDFATQVTPDGTCTAPMSQPQTKMVCCCSMGAGWGVSCDKCPAPGSAQYQDLCGSGGPGQIVDPMTGNMQEIDECKMMPGKFNVCRQHRHEFSYDARHRFNKMNLS